MNQHQSIGTERAIVCGVVAIVLGVMRLAGHHGPTFQAISHLVVGGFGGAAAMGWFHGVGGWKYPAVLAVGLSVLELVAFLVGVGR